MLKKLAISALALSLVGGFFLFPSAKVSSEPGGNPPAFWLSLIQSKDRLEKEGELDSNEPIGGKREPTAEPGCPTYYNTCAPTWCGATCNDYTCANTGCGHKHYVKHY